MESAKIILNRTRLADDKIARAIQVAKVAHRGQTRRGGGDYFYIHVDVVGLRAGARYTDDEHVVGLLHDTLEDSDLTAGWLRNKFSPEVVDAVVAITKIDGEPYATYIQRVGHNQFARRVKIEDISHNMESLDPKPTKDKNRKAKYGVALLYLKHLETWSIATVPVTPS